MKTIHTLVSAALLMAAATVAAKAETARILQVSDKPMVMGEGRAMSGSPADGTPAAGAGDVIRAGTIEISKAFTKAMLPGQPVGGGYLTITNTGDVDDRLLSASSAVAGAVEVHEMVMQGQIMKMRRIDKGVVIPAGGSVILAPGGPHLMFMRIKAPFRAGDRVNLTLSFEKAGQVEVVLPVQAAGSSAKP
jgi:copper(I)-binding protein